MSTSHRSTASRPLLLALVLLVAGGAGAILGCDDGPKDNTAPDSEVSTDADDVQGDTRVEDSTNVTDTAAEDTTAPDSMSTDTSTRDLGECPDPLADSDQDGVVDCDDACVDEPEDVDGDRDDDGCPDLGDGNGTVPAPVAQSGVAYVAHFDSDQLMTVRLDGTTPRLQAPTTLDGPVHSMEIDLRADLVFVLHDIDKTVVLYGVTRPTSTATDVPAPSKLATLTFDNAPRFVELNTVTERAFVLTTRPLSDEGPQTNADLQVIDYSDPSSPQVIATFEVPSTTNYAIDEARNILFLEDGRLDELWIYDLHEDGLEPLDDLPINLIELFPQENQFVLQLRNFVADPTHHRLYAGRSQSALSELAVFEYPAAIPRDGARYSQFATGADLSVVADAFDVDVPLEQRDNLLDAYRPVLDPLTQSVFFVADAWNGTSASAIVIPVFEHLALGPGCDEWAGTGCFLRSVSANAPGSYLRTDGAACVDATQKVVVATSVSMLAPEDPGLLHLYKYDDQLAMTRWVDADGDSLGASVLPVDVVCH